MAIDQGNAQMSAVGFFNPMFGGGDAVSVSGGTGGGADIEGAFDIEDSKIVRCALVFGRQWLQCEDTKLDILGEDQIPTGVIYAEIDHSTTKLKLAVKHDETGHLPDNSLQKSYRALYYGSFSGNLTGNLTFLWADVRFQPVMFAMN